MYLINFKDKFLPHPSPHILSGFKFANFEDVAQAAAFLIIGISNNVPGKTIDVDKLTEALDKEKEYQYFNWNFKIEESTPIFASGLNWWNNEKHFQQIFDYDYTKYNEA